VDRYRRRTLIGLLAGLAGSIALVSTQENRLLGVLLGVVVGGPTHISSPLRTSLRRTQVVRGRVTHVDLETRRATLAVDESAPGSGEPAPAARELTGDHLVFALGSVSNYLGLQNVRRLAFDFKSLLDAMRIRNHVIDMFQRADREPDPARRQELWLFVLVHGVLLPILLG
jgi:NADH dehydrogenase